MTTDRELLELAAKAAGLKFATTPEEGDELGRMYTEHLGLWIWHFPDWWNPLVDDGDALRLAVALHMFVAIGDVASDASLPTGKSSNISHIPDKYAATRRAIVRAAAEIGKDMK